MKKKRGSKTLRVAADAGTNVVRCPHCDSVALVQITMLRLAKIRIVHSMKITTRCRGGHEFEIEFVDYCVPPRRTK